MASDRASVDREEAALALVKEAERVLARYVRPASLPREETHKRSVESGDLQRVLVLYTQAMETDPSEPTYPWNLASSLRRLGQPQLSLAFIEQAIRVAEETDDSEWTDSYACLAWADVALAARQFDIALVALARARAQARDDDALADIGRLLVAVEKESGAERRAAALAHQLEGLTA